MFRKSLFKHWGVAFVTVLAASAALVSADPPNDIKAAIQKIADAPNYSWTTTTVNANGGRSNSDSLEGKWQKDVLTYLHGSRPNAEIEIYIKGDKIAMKGLEGTWQTIDEAAKADDANGGPNNLRFMAMRLRHFSPPISQAQNSLKDLTNIQKTDDGYSADLTQEAVIGNLTPTTNPEKSGEFGLGPTFDPDDNNPTKVEVTDAKATVTFSIQDGMLTKIKIHETASISYNGGDPRNLDTALTTTFTNVGTTTIDVPADAKAKLAS